MKKIISHDEFIGRLDMFIKKRWGTRMAAAEYFGVSRQYMTAILTGKIPPSKNILEKMNWESTIYYSPKGGDLTSFDGINR